MSKTKANVPVSKSPFWQFSIKFYAVPGVAQGGIQGGRHAAKTIRRRLSGEPTPPFHYSNKGDGTNLYQRVYSTDGKVTQKLAGAVKFSTTHGHFHAQGFQDIGLVLRGSEDDHRDDLKALVLLDPAQDFLTVHLRQVEVE